MLSGQAIRLRLAIAVQGVAGETHELSSQANGLRLAIAVQGVAGETH